MFLQSWLDERLKWDTGRTQDYSSINYMFSTERYTWKPTIYVENSYVSCLNLSVYKSILRIYILINKIFKIHTIKYIQSNQQE